MYLGGGGTNMNNSKISVNLGTSTDLVNFVGPWTLPDAIHGSARDCRLKQQDLHTSGTGLFANNASQQVTVRTAGARP